MTIGIIGKGAFGSAIEFVLQQNKQNTESVDVGDSFSSVKDVLVIACPTQAIRGALETHADWFTKDILFLNCAKGIEKKTGLLPQDIVLEVTGSDRYAVLAGPSFASEIKDEVPTVVNIATNSSADRNRLAEMFTTDTFKVETVSNVLELELAGAMKNIYALAAGYVAGSGGGENTRAHLQVVALREYALLVQSLEGDHDVLRPSVVGDLILTCASAESRNYQYGLALAGAGALPESTAEGVHTAEAITVLARNANVSLPLAEAVLELVQSKSGAKEHLYSALGFDIE